MRRLALAVLLLLSACSSRPGPEPDHPEPNPRVYCDMVMLDPLATALGSEWSDEDMLQDREPILKALERNSPGRIPLCRRAHSPFPLACCLGLDLWHEAADPRDH